MNMSVSECYGPSGGAHRHAVRLELASIATAERPAISIVQRGAAPRFSERHQVRSARNAVYLTAKLVGQDGDASRACP